MNYIGTSSWSIPKNYNTYFPPDGSQLERYSSILNAMEINSSFYKIHLARTYEKWNQSTPAGFKFSVKLNRAFTHDCDLKPDSKKLEHVLTAIGFLEDKWKVLLLQFPGSAEFNAKKMKRFYKIIRKCYTKAIVVEPRNITWVCEEAITLMKEYNVSKVIADPEKCKSIDFSFAGIKYYRLHGAPEIYRSAYTEDYLLSLKSKIESSKKENWVMFDNSMFNHATLNALELSEMLK